MSTYGSSWSRHVPYETTDFDKRVRARLDGVELDQNDPQNWSKEKVKAAAEMFQREDRKLQAVNVRVANANAWLSEHPEFENTTGNVALMNHELIVRFGDVEWTLAHYDQAYASLKSSGFLKLNKAELAKQEQQSAQARAAAERVRAAMPSEDEMEKMSLTELRMRENGTWGK